MNILQSHNHCVQSGTPYQEHPTRNTLPHRTVSCRGSIAYGCGRGYPSAVPFFSPLDTGSQSLHGCLQMVPAPRWQLTIINVGGTSSFPPLRIPSLASCVMLSLQTRMWQRLGRLTHSSINTCPRAMDLSFAKSMPDKEYSCSDLRRPDSLTGSLTRSSFSEAGDVYPCHHIQRRAMTELVFASVSPPPQPAV